MKKKLLLTMATISCLTTLSLGTVAMASANEQVPLSAEQLTSFHIEQGASIRQNSDYNGIRFRSLLSPEEYERFLLNDYYEMSVGSLIVPASYNDVTEETVFGENHKYTDSFRKEEAGAEDKTYIVNIRANVSDMVDYTDKAGASWKAFNSVLLKIEGQALVEEFKSIAYLKTVANEGDEPDYTFLSTESDARSVAYVAQVAQEENLSDPHGVIAGIVEDASQFDTTYTERHYKENDEGEYVEVMQDTNVSTLKINTDVSLTAKSYEGYRYNAKVANAKENGKVLANDKLELSAYYDKIDYGEIQSFEYDNVSFTTSGFAWTNTWGQLSISDEQTAGSHSTKALKYTFAEGKTWDAIYMNNYADKMPKLSYFNKASVMVYNAGDYTHEFSAEGGQKIVLQPKQWNKFVFDPNLGNANDTQFNFSIVNWKAGDVQSDENLVLYLDDFRYEFGADLTVDKNTAINVETALGLDAEGWDYKDVTVTGPSFTASSLAFTPTTAGDYTVSFKARRGEYAYDTFTVTVTVNETQKVLYDFEKDVSVGASFGSNQIKDADYGYSSEIKNSGNRSLKITTSITWFQITFWNIDTTGYSKLLISVYVEGTGKGWINIGAGASQKSTGEWLHLEVDVSSITSDPKLTVNFENVTAVYLDDIILTK